MSYNISPGDDQAATKIREDEANEIELVRIFIAAYIHNGGSRKEEAKRRAGVASAAGASKQWLSDLLSENPKLRPKSISWARFKAVTVFLGNVPMSLLFEGWDLRADQVRMVRKRPARSPRVGDRYLMPLEVEILKAVAGLPDEALQDVVWHARAKQRALTHWPKTSPCVRCAEMTPDKDLQKAAGLCRACASWAADIPDYVSPAELLEWLEAASGQAPTPKTTSTRRAPK